MNLVSIIIPMYNEETNIENCIKILKDQTNQKFDVIFIDDGSSDNTVDKLNEFLNSGVKFNYKVIQQRNKGASEARKAGIYHSSTEFVTIFDCDDKLSIDLIDKVYETYNKCTDVDIILPDMRMENIRKEWDKFIFYTKDMDLTSIDCVIHSLNGWRVHGFMTVKKSIIIKSYLEYEKYNINNENYLNNDEVITRLNFSNSKNISRNNAIYYYRYNNLSTTKKINKNRYLTINNAMIIKKYYTNNDRVKVSANEELIAVIWGVMINMHKNKAELENLFEWKKMINYSTKKINYISSINQLSMKKKIQLSILKLIN